MKVGTHKIYFTLRIIVIRLNNKLVLGFRRRLLISFFAFEKVAVQYILRPCNRKTSCTYFQPFHKWGSQNFLPSIIHLHPLFPGYTIFSYMFSLLSLFASKNAHKHSWCYDISTILLSPIQATSIISSQTKPSSHYILRYINIHIVYGTNLTFSQECMYYQHFLSRARNHTYTRSKDWLIQSS